MENLCRLCAQQSASLKSVFTNLNGRLLIDLISIVCPIRIDATDEFSQKICDDCLEIVVSANKLRTTSIKTDLDFRLGNYSTVTPFEPNTEEPPIVIKQEIFVNADPLIEVQSHFEHQTVTRNYGAHRKETSSDNNNPEYFCIYCQRIHISLSVFIRHMKSVHGLYYYRPYKCSICGLNAWTLNRIERHQEHHHPQMTAEWFRCDICSVRKKHKLSLERHMLKSHTKGCRHMKNVHGISNELNGSLSENLTIRPPRYASGHSSSKRPWMACTECTYKSAHQSNFRRHMKTHHNLTFSFKEKSNEHVIVGNTKAQSSDSYFFKCQLCSKRCRTAKEVETHTREFHEPSDVKPLRCELCGSIFESRTLFLDHCAEMHRNEQKETPAGHHCDICSEEFSTQFDFEDHNQNNHKYNFYDCYNYPCKQRFPAKHLFHKHLKQHKPVLPDDNDEFRCPAPACGRKSKTLSNLRRHILSAHFTKQQIAERTAGTGLKS